MDVGKDVSDGSMLKAVKSYFVISGNNVRLKAFEEFAYLGYLL